MVLPVRPDFARGSLSTRVAVSSAPKTDRQNPWHLYDAPEEIKVEDGEYPVPYFFPRYDNLPSGAIDSILITPELLNKYELSIKARIDNVEKRTMSPEPINWQEYLNRIKLGATTRIVHDLLQVRYSGEMGLDFNFFPHVEVIKKLESGKMFTLATKRETSSQKNGLSYITGYGKQDGAKIVTLRPIATPYANSQPR